MLLNGHPNGLLILDGNLIDDNKKLEVNLNTMEGSEPIQGEQEINSKYKLVPNKKAFTIRIGNRVKIPSTPWINQYMICHARRKIYWLFRLFLGC